MSEAEMYATTLRHIALRSRYKSRELKQAEWADKSAWERTRLICFFTAAPHMGKTGPKTPEAFMPLEWDKTAKKVAANTPEQQAAMREDLKRKMAEWAANDYD